MAHSVSNDPYCCAERYLSNTMSINHAHPLSNKTHPTLLYFNKNVNFQFSCFMITRLVLRIFGPEGDEVTGERRKLHNEELNDLYCSPNTVRVIKPR